jgi:hypothetical protein
MPSLGMALDESDRELLGNLIIVAAKIVYFVGTLLRSLLIVFVVVGAILGAIQANQSDELVLLVFGYLIGRWHQARITKQRSNSNNSLRKSA